MGILAIGDLHLKERLIIPLVDKVIQKQNLDVDTIILMGDYVDEWGITRHAHIYQDELDYLVGWVKEKREQGVEVVALLGNHDIPYLTRNYRHYSNVLPDVQRYTAEKLIELEPRLYYQYGDWMFTHAGIVGSGKVDLEKWDNLDFNSHETIAILDEVETTVGFARGGSKVFGSIVWADYNRETLDYPHEQFPKQVVGHTPVVSVNPMLDIIGIDTFSMMGSGYPIGDGSLLFIDDGGARAIGTDYLDII